MAVWFCKGSFVITSEHLWHGTVRRVIFHGPNSRRDRQTIPPQVTIMLCQADSASVTLPKESRHVHRCTRCRTEMHALSHADSSRMCGGLCIECQVLYSPGVLSRVGHVLSDHHDGCFPEGRSTGELKQDVCGS